MNIIKTLDKKKSNNDTKTNEQEVEEIRTLAQGLTLADIEEARAIHQAETASRSPTRALMQQQRSSATTTSTSKAPVVLPKGNDAPSQHE